LDAEAVFPFKATRLFIGRARHSPRQIDRFLSVCEGDHTPDTAIQSIIAADGWRSTKPKRWRRIMSISNGLTRAAATLSVAVLSGCASQGPGAIALDPPAAHNPASISVARTLSLRVSSENTVRSEHYEVPPDYDSNVALHPYTSGLGPCPQGGPGKLSCSSEVIPPSHHNR